MASLPLFLLSSLFHLLLLSSAEDKKPYPQGCPPFPCGKHGNIGFPYHNMTNPECGLYTINCSEAVPSIRLKRGGQWYEIDIISFYGDSIFIINGEPGKQFDSIPCESIESYALPGPSILSNLSSPSLMTVFNCSHSPDTPLPQDFHHRRCGYHDIYYTLLNTSFPAFLRQCSKIQLPGYNQTYDHEILSSPSFNLDVYVSEGCRHCIYNKKGQCQINDKDEFHCSNAKENGNMSAHMPTGKSQEFLIKVAIGATFSGMSVLIILFFYMRKLYFLPHKSIFFWKQSPSHRKIEAFLKNYGSLHARRYSYLDVKKMTNSFKEKLGQGGFGSVYKGKLHDGCLVAVKVLNESKDGGEEFINEVAAISRTSHVNVVSLLGFCFEGVKRALIYEFMSNGSLEKFVFDENVTEISQQLGWETYYQISLGIARGLEYLHLGCNTRILHFDIKPHNILLDAEFVPKISDFGLARICTRKESLISMLSPRGTIGYIALEVFSRNFGGISHKSDVYSYGMMVLEMIGGKKNVNIGAENTSEIYFPHWIYKRLELDEGLGLKKITNEEDRVKVRKMIIVSLWCIQTDPLSRPAMSRVIEMLEGSLDFLQVPPKPFLYSPPRSPLEDFCSTTFESLYINVTGS